MKHASASALDEVERLLDELRKHAALKEKKRGIFYRKSVAFLHFHEDRAGLFADLKVGDRFERSAVRTAGQRRQLLKRVDELLTRQG